MVFILLFSLIFVIIYLRFKSLMMKSADTDVLFAVILVSFQCNPVLSLCCVYCD